MAIDRAQINRRFWPSELTKAQHEDCDELRHAAEAFAEEIIGRTPASREQSLALTQLEQASFWAVASIARHQTTD